MRYISLFSGIEAATVAWEPLGWEPVAFCEIDAFPSAVLAHRYPDVPNHGDITKVDWRKHNGEVDVVVGGSPCQSFSVAGKREGLEGESGLMFEYIRAVREIMPRYFVWENVPGALSSEGGRAFRQLLSEMDALGYGLAWRVLDAQFFGVAQRRERVFLVGCLGDAERAAEILFERESLRWDSPPSRDKRKELAAEAQGGSGGCCTLKARCGCAGGGKGAPVQEDMSATLATGKDQALFVIDRAAYNQGINAQYDPHIEETQLMDCLVARGPHAVGVVQELYENHPQDSRVNGPLDVAPTVHAKCGTGGGNVPLVRNVMQVRKLTPRECERLQGFPDDWTMIPWKGKEAEACPDTPRYKALGNSMAVPVMRWIGERMETE